MTERMIENRIRKLLELEEQILQLQEQADEIVNNRLYGKALKAFFRIFIATVLTCEARGRSGKNIGRKIIKVKALA